MVKGEKSGPVNHQKAQLLKMFKIDKNDYPVDLLKVQGLFGDAAPPFTEMETSVCCVRGPVSFMSVRLVVPLLA